jgi:hypothetical protein
LHQYRIGRPTAELRWYLAEQWANLRQSGLLKLPFAYRVA